MITAAFLALMLVVTVACALNVISGLEGFGFIPRTPASATIFAVKNYLADAVLWTCALAMCLAIVAMALDRLRRGRVSGNPPQRRPVDGPVVVCLIAYNEEKAVQQMVQSFFNRPEVGIVIVVDNNSTDETSTLAKAAGAVVVHERRQGYGYACIRALREGLASGLPVVVLCEADGTYDADDLPKLLLYLEHGDMVVGTRTVPGLVHAQSQLDTFLSWLNQLGAKLLQLRYTCSAHMRFLGCARFTDLGCTYRAIRREALASIIDDLCVGGDHFSPHMLAVAIRHNLTVIEVPVTFWPRIGVSKGASGSVIRSFRVGLAMLREILMPSSPRRSAGGMSR
jgi:hypothetical protein